MRHRRKFNHLSRKTAHRRQMLANMASSLILHKRIQTTVAKAKALRSYIEPLITKSKDDNTHSRRVVFSYLQSKEAVTELFRDVSVKVAERPGGYTRIIKTGARLGDNAEMCMMELVDYNENLLGVKEADTGKSTRRRRGRGGKKAAQKTEDVRDTSAVATDATATEVEEEEKDLKEDTSVEEVKDEVATEAPADKDEETKEEKPEDKAEEPVAEEKKEEPEAKAEEEKPEAEEKLPEAEKKDPEAEKKEVQPEAKKEEDKNEAKPAAEGEDKSEKGTDESDKKDEDDKEKK